MAVSAAAISGVKRNTAGSRTQVTRRVTFDSLYVTGGEPLAASAFGLTRIQHVYTPILRSGFTADIANVDPLIQTDGSLLLRVRAGAGTQAASEADLSSLVVDLTVEGY